MGTIPPAASELVRRVRLGFVATVNEDGGPNLSPRGSLTVWDEAHLLWADLRSPRTTANLRLRPATEVCVVDPFLRRGYRFRGTATVLEEAADIARAREILGPEITDIGRRARAFLRLKVEETREVVSPAYDLGATAEELRAYWSEYYARTAHGLSAAPDDRY
jgi:predicted pyridoxine 5'-phosphate oxidase superfamily flavin-nucleotide-binding protein